MLTTYLARQRDVLSANLRAYVPADVRHRHAAWLHRTQQADGGFAGREGASDPYYTAFGLLSLTILDAMTPAIGDKAMQFLQTHALAAKHLVDAFSLLHAYRLLQMPGVSEKSNQLDLDNEAVDLVLNALNDCRTPDGGYARTPGQNAGSTYATFLTVLCYEELGRPVPEPDRLRSFLDGRRRDDCGYVEFAPMKRSGANPTAAAVAVLRILAGNGDWEQRQTELVAFFSGLRSPEGGFRANMRIPLADLLSTYTSLWTLYDLQGLDRIDRDAELRYVRSLEQPDGGFRAGLWDDRVDVEYTFYGLGSLALLSAPLSGSS